VTTPLRLDTPRVHEEDLGVGVGQERADLREHVGLEAPVTDVWIW